MAVETPVDDMLLARFFRPDLGRTVGGGLDCCCCCFGVKGRWRRRPLGEDFGRDGERCSDLLLLLLDDLLSNLLSNLLSELLLLLLGKLKLLQREG